MALRRRIGSLRKRGEILLSYFVIIFDYGLLRVSQSCLCGPSRTVDILQGFTLGSAYVANGHENLEEMAQCSANPGRRFVSRMVTAQFDSIGYKHVLVKLKREVLDELWLLMQKRTDNTFFTVYLIVFMMLHEVSVACQDRRRRAKEQGLKVRKDLTSWPISCLKLALATS